MPDQSLKDANPENSQPLRLRVAAIALFDGPLMLVSKRPEGSYYGGWWEWPGGKCHPDESPQSCAVRELHEEIGLAAQEVRLFEKLEAHYPGRVVELHVFTGELAAGSTAAPDAHEHQWVMPGDALKMQFLEPNIPVLKRMIVARQAKAPPVT